MIVNNDLYEHIWKQVYLTRGIFALFVFTLCPVAKADGGAEAVAYHLVGGW